MRSGRLSILLLLVVAGCHKPVAAPPPALTPTITIHVQKDAAQRALDEGELMKLLQQDFRNMDSTRDQVDMAVRRRMDVLMKRLMTKRMWVEQ